MSSYELLELLEHMDDDGAFKRAARGGEYSEGEQVWRHLANEISKLRAGFHAVHGGERYAPKVFLTLAEIEEQTDDAEEMLERREGVFSFADRSTLKALPSAENDDPDGMDD